MPFAGLNGGSPDIDILKGFAMNGKPETLEDVLLTLAGQWQLLGVAMIVITLFSLLVCSVLLKSNKPVMAHRFMSVPIFVTTMPGIFYSLILAYLLLLTNSNMMTIPIFYFFPPLWMLVSFYLFSRLVNFQTVPGFERLSGLAFFMTIIFAAFFLLFKLRIVAIVWFNPFSLFIVAVVLYIAGRLALKRMLK
jgi:hypothetical protein